MARLTVPADTLCWAGELLLAAGLTDEARQVLGESLTAATKIGHPDLIRRINELLNRPGEEDEEK